MPMLHFYTSGFLEFSESIGMEHSEAVVRRCSVNKVFLKISENSQENTCTRVSFLNFIQLALAQVFSFKFCEIFKNTFFTYNTSGDCFWNIGFTLSLRRPLSNRNQSTDLLCKPMDWFLYDKGLHHERVKMG